MVYPIEGEKILTGNYTDVNEIGDSHQLTVSCLCIPSPHVKADLGYRIRTFANSKAWIGQATTPCGIIRSTREVEELILHEARVSLLLCPKGLVVQMKRLLYARWQYRRSFAVRIGGRHFLRGYDRVFSATRPKKGSSCK